MKCPKCDSILIRLQFHESGKPYSEYWVCDKCGWVFTDWQQSEIDRLQGELEKEVKEKFQIDSVNQNLIIERNTLKHAFEKALESLQQENSALKAKVEAFQRLMRSLEDSRPLCPDHRDKQRGKECLVCTIETLQRQLAELQRRWQTGPLPKAGWYWIGMDMPPGCDLFVPRIREFRSDVPCDNEGSLEYYNQFCPTRPDRWWSGPIEPPKEA